MEQLTALLTQYGLLLVFVNVFLVQAGLPIPAVPTLLVAGALSMHGDISLPMIILVSVAASLLGDLIWYITGRYYGLRVLRLLCRVSISPDSCVRQTDLHFTRWGAPSLIFAKFIPGFATVAPPLAGALRIPLGPFLGYSAISAALWSGLATGIGLLFSEQIAVAVSKLEEIGAYALVLLGAALVLFIAIKWWQRQRFFKVLRMARITAAELYRLIEDGHTPIVVDVRSAADRQFDARRLPGSITVDLENLDAHIAGIALDREIILYCT